MIEVIQGIRDSYDPLQVSNKARELQGDDAIFTEALDAAKNLLETVQAADDVTAQLTNDFMTGESENIHELMIAQEKSSILLQFTMQVRNQVITAYNEIMRMQV